MKSNSGTILGLMMLAGLWAAAPARAEDAPQSCEVPDYLLSSESALPKVADAVKSGHSLDILVSVVNHQYVGRQRLSRAVAGGAEGETACGHGQFIGRHRA
jgi:hypothetical protein